MQLHANRGVVKIAALLGFLVMTLFFVLASSRTADRVEAVACQAAISFGENYDCAISVAFEVDTFTFSGTSGEVVYARAGKAGSSGLSDPKIEIKRPNGTVLCSAYNGSNWSKVTCTLDATGTHEITVKKNSGSGTGAYALYSQRLNSPQNVTAASFGSSYTGNLPGGSVADYVITAAAGDIVFARVAKAGSSGGLSDPRV